MMSSLWLLRWLSSFGCARIMRTERVFGRRVLGHGARLAVCLAVAGSSSAGSMRAAPEWAGDPSIVLTYWYSDAAGAAIGGKQTLAGPFSATATTTWPAPAVLAGTGKSGCISGYVERAGVLESRSPEVGPVCATFRLTVPVLQP